MNMLKTKENWKKGQQEGPVGWKRRQGGRPKEKKVQPENVGFKKPQEAAQERQERQGKTEGRLKKNWGLGTHTTKRASRHEGKTS